MPNQIDPFILQPAPNMLRDHPDILRMAQDIARRYAHNSYVNDDALRGMGGRLWQTLGVDEAALQTARTAAGTRTLPLLIVSDDPAIQQLPWETLHHPAYGFLGREAGFALVRQSPHAPVDYALEKGPLRVLLFTSLPDDVDAERGRLDVEAEQAQVLAVLSPAIGAGRVVLEMPDDGRFVTLQKRLQQFKPHLLFLSGHGRFVRPQLPDEVAYASFLFETEEGYGDAVRGAEIAAALRGTAVRAVVLSACQSGQGASDALTHGLMWRLAQVGVPHVIGMRESILDRAGTLFAEAFFEQIGAQRRIDVALQAGRRAIVRPLAELPDASGLGEVSLGQWSLPVLLTQGVGKRLIDWQFTPQPARQTNTAQGLGGIQLPAQFIGRRTELRDLKRRDWRQLLITGAGGQGKTALAGRIALDFAQRGYRVVAWSARPENVWDDFELDLLLALSPENSARYDGLLPRLKTERQRVRVLLQLLLREAGGQLLLFFDNLESVQDAQTQALTDERLAAWIAAAQGVGVRLLLTSRWRLPDWPQGDHVALRPLIYGDFLRLALALHEQGQLPRGFLGQRKRLRRVHEVLYGNARGLTFFANAVQGMDSADEAAFLAKLRQVESEVQTDMALAAVVGQLPAAAGELLRRLIVYQTPVPVEGVQVLLGADVTEGLQRLLAVSLVETLPNERWLVTEYQVASVVAAWLAREGKPPLAHWETAARYQRYLYEQERRTVEQAVNVHHALTATKQTEQAHRWLLDHIVGSLNMAGLYRTLLDDWLPAARGAADAQTRAEALGQTGKQHLHLGDYATALDFLQQSLAIRREIGDKSGEGTTLNNISQIYDARGDYATALDFLQQSLAIQREIGDKSGEGTTLNNMATTAHARGDYATALDFLQQSLAIRREIGDKSGEGTTLNNISQIFKARGDYATALDFLQQSLAIRREIGDKSGEGTTLNNISQIFKARGDYATALDFLQQSLAIQREIGDTAGLCATLFNMGHIHLQNEEINEAVGAWVTVYRIAKPIGLANVLAALEQLAPQLGLPAGLAGWEMLAQQMGE